MFKKHLEVVCTTGKDEESAREMLRKTVRSAGGEQIETDEGVTIRNGKVGVPLDFLYDVTAEYRCNRYGEDTTIDCDVTYQPSIVFWIAIVVMVLLFVVPAILLAILFFLIDPSAPHLELMQRLEDKLTRPENQGGPGPVFP